MKTFVNFVVKKNLPQRKRIFNHKGHKGFHKVHKEFLMTKNPCVLCEKPLCSLWLKKFTAKDTKGFHKVHEEFLS